MNVFVVSIGTLSIDNKTDDNDRNRGILGQGFHFRRGKRSLSSAASQTDNDFFFAKNFVLLQSCYGGKKRDLHAKSVVLYLRFRDNGKPP